jgi:hypothetical protein
LEACFSNLSRSNFGKFMLPKDLNAMTATDPVIVSDVATYFKDKGVDCELHRSGASLRCSGSAAAVASLLQADVNEYSHTQSARKVHAVLGSYTFPAELEGEWLFWWPDLLLSKL